MAEVEIAKGCNPPWNDQQKDALVRLLNGQGWSLEEIAERGKALIRRHTYGSIAFEHWSTPEEENIQQVKAKYDCSYCGTEWWSLPGTLCPTCYPNGDKSIRKKEATDE